MLYVTQVKRWTAIIVGIIGVLVAAHAVPLPGNEPGDWGTFNNVLMLVKALATSLIAVINALTEESS